MKGLLGLRYKAASAVKARLNQPLPKPFEENTGDAPEVRHSSPQRDSGQRPAASTKGSVTGALPGNTPDAHQAGTASLDPVLRHLIANARSEAVREQFMQSPAAEYTTHQDITLLVASYNVNGRAPAPDADLREWLSIEGSHGKPSIVAVGFQELVPLNAGNIVMGASLESAAAWDTLIEAALNQPSTSSAPPEDRRLSLDPSKQLPEAHHAVIAASGSAAGNAAAARDHNKADLMSWDDDIPDAPVLSAGAEGSAGGSLVTDAAADALATGPAIKAYARMHSRTRSTVDSLLGDDDAGYLSPLEDTFSILSDDALPPPPTYVQVAAKQMVGIYLSVWVRRSLLLHIRGVQVTCIGTGGFGYLGNKGAVAVRMRMHDSGLAFVCTHMSSGEAEGDDQKRNHDYAEIVRRLQFPPDTEGASDADALLGTTASGMNKVMQSSARLGQWGTNKGLMAIENLIWMGDLNYRLTMPDAEVRAALREGRTKDLLAADELGIMMRSKRAFEGWKEGAVKFPPTFKYKRGAAHYLGDEEEDAASEAGSQDLRAPSSASLPAPGTPDSHQSQQPSAQNPEKEKRRTPAWTDRILWRPAEGLMQHSYATAPLLLSDHRPVNARFSLKAKVFSRERVDAAVDAARRIVDAREMEARPKCELEPTNVDAGTCLYGAPHTAHLILTNTSRNTAAWQFMPLPGVMFGDREDRVFRPTPRWASISPQQGVLQPGEAAEVVLQLLIVGGSDGTAELLATSQGKKLDAILVLRIQDGNDIFCSVAGTFLPSFFGLSLPTLSTLQRPLMDRDAVPGAKLAALKIDTARRTRSLRQASHDLDVLTGTLGGGFYSPASSLANSPFAGSGNAEEFARHRRYGSNVSSLGSETEFDATTNPQHAASTPPQHQYESSPEHTPPPRDASASPHSTHLPPRPNRASSGPLPRGVTESGPRHRKSADRGSHSASPERGRGGEHARASVSPDREAASSSGAEGLVPPELWWGQTGPEHDAARLGKWLRDPQRLAAPHCLDRAADDLMHAALDPGGNVPAIARLRTALDMGLPVPEETTPAEGLATLLAWLVALPSPLLPVTAARSAERCLPLVSEAELWLSEALAPAEWAVFKLVIGIFRQAVLPDVRKLNGVVCAHLTGLLADALFGSIPPAMVTGSGKPLDAQHAAELQRTASGIAATLDRRAAFVSLFVDPSIDFYESERA